MTDGIARKYGFRTRWGQFIDPLADKILNIVCIYRFLSAEAKGPHFFGTTEFVPCNFLIAVIIFRDMVLTLARSVQELRGKGIQDIDDLKNEDIHADDFYFSDDRACFTGCNYLPKEAAYRKHN